MLIHLSSTQAVDSMLADNILVLSFLCALSVAVVPVASSDYYGVQIGRLEGAASGDVYLANASAVQIVNFHWEENGGREGCDFPAHSNRLLCVQTRISAWPS